jgi:thiol-disulfide isomerase/thioredoxin
MRIFSIVLLFFTTGISAVFAQKNWLDLSLQTIDGNHIPVKEVIEPGKYTLIDVWGLWCKPCMIQHEAMKSAFASRRELKIVALNYKDEPKKWRSFIKNDTSSWYHGRIIEKTAIKYQLFRFPFNVLLNESGAVLCEDCDLTNILKLLPK